VSEIASTAKEQNLRGIPLPTGDRVFPAYVELKNTKGADLRPGTSCVVTIVVDRIPKALTVPLECVFDRDQKKLVYVLRKGNFVPVEVELGPRNDDVVVVRKGLRPGDRVALHDMRAGPAGPSDGGGGKPAGLPLP
jgi:multidrug efflux pump subunit AcrA (membrane-fusion protein)